LWVERLSTGGRERGFTRTMSQDHWGRSLCYVGEETPMALSFNFALRKNVPLMDLGDEADPTDAPSAAFALRP
jgi:hypothetical protein